jgi:hypothetical protein
MDELFRLTVVRAADSTDALTVSLSLNQRLEIDLTEAESWSGRVATAEQYLNGAFGPSFPPLIRLADLELYSQLQVFLDALHANPQTTGGDALRQLSGSLLDPPNLSKIEPTYEHLSNTFLALYIAPRRDRPSLLQIAEPLRLVWLLRQIRDADPILDTADIISQALAATIVMPPPGVFGVPNKRVYPVGIADLMLVKQHISGYELGEVARIENILKGESRTHTQKHSLVNERDVTTDTTKETVKEQELTTKDTINLRNEVQNTLNEQLKVGAGVSFTYDGSPYHVESNVNFAYDRSSSQASTSAQELSKDVVQKTASKLTERIQEIVTTKITETLEDTENQDYNNSATGSEHISGVYQWVEKVYTAQVFNYGKRLLFDLMVPEPGAYLLQLAQPPAPNDQFPVAPRPLTLHGLYPDEITSGQTEPPLQPFDLSENTILLDSAHKPVHDSMGNTIPDPGFYGNFVARYQVPDVEPPPLHTITVSKALATREQSVGSDIFISDTLRIDDGYKASATEIVASWYHRTKNADNVGEKNPSELDVTVGQQIFNFKEDDPPPHTNKVADEEYWGQGSTTLNDELESIPVFVKTVFTSLVAVNIEIACDRTDALYAKWQLETYGKIAARYQKLQEDYDAAQKARQFTQQVGPLGRDPETNRLTERTELKRACIAILRDQAMNGLSEIDPPSDPKVLPSDPTFKAAPSPNLNTSQDDGAIARFFEQAFEWDKIGYVCYPYYWGRQAQWHSTATLVNDDPIFETFLRAGYARVVIPVRLAFMDAVMYFLTTNQIWQGGSLPAVTDPTYLPIAEEIKDQTGAPGDEQPQGAPWTYRLPATLIKLRKDDLLPIWERDKTKTALSDYWTWIDATDKKS